MFRRPITAVAVTVAAALAATGCAAPAPPPVPAGTPVALVAATEPTAVEALSPAGCRIVSIANPHYANSVPGAVKVNAKSECNTRVPELDLSVTLLMDGRPVAKTISKAVNKSFIMNQSTYIMCKGKNDTHTFQGTALGTSFEGEEGKPYLQAKTGPAVTLKCDY